MSAVSKPNNEERRFAVGYDGDAGRPVIRGNPIVFNAWSRVLSEMNGLVRFRESIAPEAVDRTLKSAAEVLAYWNHDSGEVLGNTTSGSLVLSKSNNALSMELYPTSEWLTTHHAAGMKRGDVKHMSFGFSVIDDAWSDQPDENGVYSREIRDMEFSEVSIVGRPAYPQTSVQFSSRGEEQRVYVPAEALERFAATLRVDFARLKLKNALAR